MKITIIISLFIVVCGINAHNTQDIGHILREHNKNALKNKRDENGNTDLHNICLNYQKNGHLLDWQSEEVPWGNPFICNNSNQTPAEIVMTWPEGPQRAEALKILLALQGAYVMEYLLNDTYINRPGKKAPLISNEWVVCKHRRKVLAEHNKNLPINQHDENGNTDLHVIALQCDQYTAEQLKEKLESKAGANPFVRDKRGALPWRIAVDKFNKDNCPTCLEYSHWLLEQQGKYIGEEFISAQ
jgi:hypothetical protein